MDQSHDNSIYSLVVSWALSIPMLFFVARGTFSFDHSSTNNELAINSGTLSGAWNIGAAYFQAQQLLVYILVCIIMTSLLARCIRRLTLKSSAMLISLPVLAVASVLWSQNAAKSAIAATTIVLLTCFSVYLTERFTPIRQIQFFYLMGIVTLLVSLMLVFLYPAAGIANFGDKGAWQGLFVHKNHCAIVMTYLVAPALCMKSRSQLGRIGKTIYLASTIALIFMTRSRTGWMLVAATMLFVVVAYALGRLRAREKALFLILAFCAIAVASIFAVTYFAQLSVLLGKSATMSGRTDIWKAILPALSDRPVLGYGFRAFWLGMQGPSSTIALTTGYIGLANAENSVLQMWLELGAVGVCLMLAILFVSVKNALKCMIAAPSSYVTWCSVNVFLTILALSDGDKIMYPNTVEWILYVMSYVALAEEAKKLRQGTDKSSVPNSQMVKAKETTHNDYTFGYGCHTNP